MDVEGTRRLLSILEGDARSRREIEVAATQGERQLLSAFEALGRRAGSPVNARDIAALLGATETIRRGSRGIDEHGLERAVGGAGIGGDAQLANIDLQSALQKQQQTLLMLSNISKVAHDTQMSIIRRIGG